MDASVQFKEIMMKTLVPTLLLAMSISLPVVASPVCDEQFSMKQLHTMTSAYTAGKKYNLEYTLAAIVWQESSAGLYNSRKEGDFLVKSPFHILLKTAYSREGCKNDICRTLVRSRLKYDFDYAAQHAIDEITFWSRPGRTWNQVMAHYNGGYSPNHNYPKLISSKIRYLKKCVRLESESWR